MVQPRPVAVLEAPSVLGLKPTGVERLSARLIENGIVDRLGARHGGRVEPPPYGAERDPDTGTLNGRAIAEWTPRLADAVEDVLDRGEFPLVLGGDCSILLGAALALRRRGRVGLLFIDGHADFYQPEANPNGEAASMELAFATGYGPDALTNLEGRAPLFRPDDVVAFAFRDEHEQRQYGSQPLPREMLALGLREIRRTGAGAAVARALERLTSGGLEGFFIHLDADCLGDDIMPAVDYRIPGGLTWDELTQVLTAALSTGRAIGMEVTIYNPALDDDGRAGQGLTDLLVASLADREPPVPFATDESAGARPAT